MFVLNGTLQGKLLGAAPDKTIETASATLNANADKGGSKAVSALKELIYAQPEQLNVEEALIKLMKQDKDKTDRLAHFLITQTAAAKDLSNVFPSILDAVKAILSGKEMSRKALAIKTLSSLVPIEDMNAVKSCLGIVFPLMTSYRETAESLQKLAADKKKLSSKDSSALWESIVLRQHILLCVHNLCVRLGSADAIFKVASGDKFGEDVIYSLSDPDMLIVRHSAALLQRFVGTNPSVCAKALLTCFASKGDSGSGMLFKLPLWTDSLAGSDFVNACAKLGLEESSLDKKQKETFTKWAAHGLCSKNLKVFCDTVCVLSSHWDVFSKMKGKFTEDGTGEEDFAIKTSILRMEKALTTPMNSNSTKVIILHAAQKIGEGCAAYSNSSSDSSDCAKYYELLSSRLQRPIRSIILDTTETVLLRRTAIESLIWVLNGQEAFNSMQPLFASFLSAAPTLFSRIWHAYELRMRMSSELATPFLATSLKLLTAVPPCTSPFPIGIFFDTWPAALEVDPSAMLAHTLSILCAPVVPENKANLFIAKRFVCQFAGEHARELVGLPPLDKETKDPHSPSESGPKQRTPTSEPESPALVALLGALEQHSVSGSPSEARVDALEALAKVGVHVPEARVHVYEFLTTFCGDLCSGDADTALMCARCVEAAIEQQSADVSKIAETYKHIATVLGTAQTEEETEQ